MTKRVFERSHHSLLFNCLGSMSFEMWYSKLYFEYCGLLSQLLLSQFWPNFNGRVLGLREAIKKKTMKFWTLSEKGRGVSTAAKLFIDEKYGHVHRGVGGGLEFLVQTSFLYKSLFCRSPWTVSQFHNGMHGSKQRNYRVTYQPTH